MKRWRVVLGGASAALFCLIFASACCSTPIPPVPDAFEIVQPKVAGYIVIFGDTRPAVWGEGAIRKVGYDRERRMVFAQLLAEKPDLIVHTGDFVTSGSSEDAWKIWDAEAAPLADIPIFPALGNHEYMGDEGKAIRLFNGRFPRIEGRHWYTIRYDRLLIVVLDSNLHHLPPSAVARQEAWLEQTLAAADADANVSTVFIVGHNPPFTNSSVERPDPAMLKHFVERAKRCPKVRAYFSGHNHSYERFLTDGIQFVVTGGGGAPTYALRSDPLFNDEFKGPALRPFHYCKVIVEPKRIAVDVMMLKGDGTWYRGDGFTVE